MLLPARPAARSTHSAAALLQLAFYCPLPVSTSPEPPAHVLARMTGPRGPTEAGGVRVVLLDLLNLQPAAQAWTLKIFSDPAVLKIGFGFKGMVF